MLKYETFLVRGRGEMPQNTGFNKGDEYLHGIAINYDFRIGNDKEKNKLFVVTVLATQKKMSEDIFICSNTIESIFILTGTKQDYIDTPFSFFETLMLLGVAHARGVFMWTVMSDEFGFSTLPDKDCSLEKEALDKKKEVFIKSQFHE
jgi:hypothetical protein